MVLTVYFNVLYLEIIANYFIKEVPQPAVILVTTKYYSAGSKTIHHFWNFVCIKNDFFNGTR